MFCKQSFQKPLAIYELFELGSDMFSFLVGFHWGDTSVWRDEAFIHPFFIFPT